MLKTRNVKLTQTREFFASSQDCLCWQRQAVGFSCSKISSSLRSRLSFDSSSSKGAYNVAVDSAIVNTMCDKKSVGLDKDVS